MTPRRKQQLLVAASCAAIAGLGLMLWSVLDPRPAPVMIAMSLGQGVGTLSLLLFLYVVVTDLRRVRALRDDVIPPPLGDPRAKAAAPETPQPPKAGAP